MMLAVVSPIAHWGTLLPLAVQKVLQQNKLVDRALREVNTGLDSLRSGFGGMITSFAEDNTPAALTTFLQQPGTVKRLIALLMSPKEDYHFAMAVVEQAYDVDGRRDSLRALFDRTPAESYDGVFSSLERITEFISAVPEACTLSKSVVTCLTDIIDALCSKTDGLFHAPGHLARTDGNRSPGSLVSQLWILMSKTSVAIFGRTPKWSRYFEDEREMMTGWMRDAMIFGRDLVSQRRAFATAIISCSGDPNQRVSRTERRLVENLRQFLPSLMMWLRLTDFELLHQAFTLLQSLLSSFEDTGVKPEKDALAKLNEHIQKKQTRLNPSQLAKLEQALCAFDDEDVIIVEKPEMNGRSATSTRPQDVTSSRSATPSIPAKAPDRRNMIVSVRPSAKEQDTKAGPTVKSAKVAGRDSGRTFPTSVPASHASARPTLVGRTSSPSVPPPLVSARPAIKSKSTLRDPRNEGSSKATSEASSEPPSSEASGSEEEDDGPKGLASLAKLQSTPKIKKPDRSRRIMIMDDAATGPGSFHQDRLRRRDDARRTAMRLKPDLSALHRIILEWDYEYTGDQPPQSSSSMKPTHVSDSFRNYESYRRTFESLLLLECWAQLSQSRSEPQDTYTVKITSRQSVDDWIDLEALFADTVPREWALGEADIVLLKKTDTKKYILAKVLSYRSMPHQAQCSLRCRLGPGVTDPGLHISVAWTVKKVFRSARHEMPKYTALMHPQPHDPSSRVRRPRRSAVLRLSRHDNATTPRQTAALRQRLPDSDHGLIFSQRASGGRNIGSA
jgi:senataxin